MSNTSGPPFGIIITGASGFVGSEIIKWLSNETCVRKCVVSSRATLTILPKKCSADHRDNILRSSFDFDGPDVVIHLEVKQHVQNPTSADLAEFNNVNVEGTAQWLRFCSRNRIERFILFSTIKAVQGSNTGAEGVAIDEWAKGPGDTPYGKSKWEAEQLVRRWCEEDANRSALVLRPAVVYGPGNTANVFSMVKALDKGHFFLVGRNANIKSLVSLDNLCAAVIHLLRNMKPGVEVYNIVDRESYSVRDLAGMISRALGRSRGPTTIPISVAKILARVGDGLATISRRDFPLTSNRLQALLESTHFSCEKLLSTGFVHPQTTEEGIAKMVEWYKTVGRGR